jgi:hypothetical protein
MDKEIIWNLVNAALAGGLVFLGGCSTGQMNWTTAYFSLLAGMIAGIVQFKDYWGNEKPEYQNKLFKFV